MADFILRPANGGDREQLIKIWRDCFGDNEDFIADMLGCGLLESAVGAEMDGKLRACMFAFEGLCCGGLPAAYLYALGTQPEYRGLGLGRAVTACAAKRAFAGGAKAVFLRPGDEALEKWYCDVMGARVFCRSGTEIIRPVIPAPEKAREISPREYLRLRPGSFWSVGEALISAQGVVNRHFGGSFLAAGGSIMCVENTCGRVLVRELFSPRPEEALSAAAEYFSSPEIHLLRGGSEGAALLALPGSILPENPGAVPPLPFTLD